MGLLSFFTETESTLSIYRETEQADDWGNLETQGNWEYDHKETGYIQPRSGSYTQDNQRENSLSSHILYCEVGVDIVTSDRVYDGTLYYQVQFIQPAGFGGVDDHQEIDLQVLDDLP